MLSLPNMEPSGEQQYTAELAEGTDFDSAGKPVGKTCGGLTGLVCCLLTKQVGSGKVANT